MHAAIYTQCTCTGATGILKIIKLQTPRAHETPKVHNKYKYKLLRLQTMIIVQTICKQGDLILVGTGVPD
jgi:hypothetical protein